MSQHPDGRPKSSLTRKERPSSGLPRSILAALGIGCAFGVGVVVGGGLKPARGAPLSAESRDPLEVARQRTEALQGVQEKVKLTFHDELQRPPPKAGPRTVEGKTTDALAGLRPAAKEDGKAAAAQQEAHPAKAQPATAEPAAAVAAEERPVQEAVLLEDEGASDKAAPKPAEAAQAAPEQRPEPPSDGADQKPADDDEGEVAAARHDPARLRAAMARVLGDEAPARKEVRFGLQVASFPTEASARETAARLKGKGLAATVVSAEVPGKGTVYRVRVGSYADRAAADEAKERLSTEHGLSAFVVSQ